MVSGSSAVQVISTSKVAPTGKPFVFNGENHLAKVKVSDRSQEISKMFDGDEYSNWESKSSKPEISVHFSQPKIISKVVIRKHHQKPRNKYANVCFILKDQTQEIGRKCTVGTRGEPFLLERPNEIEITFSNIPNVHTVHIKFEETNLYKGTHAQIAELQIEGYFPSTGPKISGIASTKRTKPMTTTSTTTTTTSTTT